jgi:hypothetical protein
MAKKKQQQPKVEAKKEKTDELLIEKAADGEAKLKKVNINKKPLTDRQKFHEFYREEYLKDVDMDSPHHPDKHGVLGYEKNILKLEVWSPSAGKYKEQEVNGFCEYCSSSQVSAREAYDGSQK